MYYNFHEYIILNETSNNYSNGTYNITDTSNSFNIIDNQYFTKKINNASNITNNIIRHNRNNYEHNVIKKG